jgi:IS6 family transposase
MRGSQPALFRGRHFRSEVIILCLRWYLRHPLSYRDPEEMMTERGLSERCVTSIAPGESTKPTRAWPVDGPAYIGPSIRRETQWNSCCRHIGIWWRPKAFSGSNSVRGRPGRELSRSIGHPAYASAILELKGTGELGRNCRCRRSPYMNNIIEQDHRFVKKRVVASQGFRSPDGAISSIAGYEAMNIIRKGQSRWLPKGEVVGQKLFIESIFGIAA